MLSKGVSYNLNNLSIIMIQIYNCTRYHLKLFVDDDFPNDRQYQFIDERKNILFNELMLLNNVAK